jgi:hypothetical protein
LLENFQLRARLGHLTPMLNNVNNDTVSLKLSKVGKNSVQSGCAMNRYSGLFK